MIGFRTSLYGLRLSEAAHRFACFAWENITRLSVYVLCTHPVRERERAMERLQAIVTHDPVGTELRNYEMARSSSDAHTHIYIYVCMYMPVMF